MKTNNFCRLNRFVPFYDVWLYYDYRIKGFEWWYGLQVLRDYGIKTRRGVYRESDKHDGIISRVMVPKRQRIEFIKAMEQLQTRLLVSGYRNYISESEEELQMWHYY